MISTEVALAIIGVIATIAGGYWYTAKRRADTRLEAEKRLRIEAERLSMQAQAEADVKIAQSKADTEIRLSAAREDAEERAFIRAQLQAQIKLNEQFQGLLVKTSEENEANYRVLSNKWNDTNTVLVNILNRMEQQHAIEIAAIGGLPAAIQLGNAETLKDYASQIASEIGAVMSKEFRIQSMERDLYPFPDPEDPAWSEQWLVPITPQATIHRQPYFHDDVKLHKPCAVIAPEGEWARVILDRLKDWIIIDKRTGDSHCWGWLPAHTVTVGVSPAGRPAERDATQPSVARPTGDKTVVAT